ncbi:MAG: beta-propeller fold lactonase family protein [Acidobacteriaceae bacterium]|nr:beta-propeller fold lactonase family protein [Acidobacteriaceae bacterium]
MFGRTFNLLLLLTGSATLAFATAPVVTVTSPASGTSVGSPVNYVASAASPACAKGIAAMRIYTAPGVNAYTIAANSLNTNINLPTGSYGTVVQAWDNCGGVGRATVNITVSKITLPPPRFLYATEFQSGKIAEYMVNPLTGAITPTPQGWTWAHWGPVDIAAGPAGYRLYVANQGSHDINAYLINRNTGDLSPIPGSPFPIAGVGHRVVVHPSGLFVYVSSATPTSSGIPPADINAFAVQSDGSLKLVPGSPIAIPGGNGLPALAMDPLGQFLYASSFTSGGGAVAAFTVDRVSGALTPVPGSPFVVPVGVCKPSADFCQESPTDLAIEPTGKYLYGVLGIQSAVAGFVIDRANGALSDLPGSPYPELSSFGNFCPFDAFGACPNSWTESIDPSGKFIYVTDSQFNDISIFQLNGTTGVPSYVGTSGNTVGGVCVPYTVNVDPSGSFAYSLGVGANRCAPSSNAVLGFSINQGNGQVSPVSGSPFINSGVHTTNDSEEKVLVTK